MGYDYGFEYTFPEFAEGEVVGLAGLMATVILLVMLVCMAFCLVCYVLNAVGVYRIAKRRGIHHAWLAWIPVGSDWLLGSISDHYQYVVKQKDTGRRKVLLILSAVLAALGGGLLGSFIGAIVSSIQTGPESALAAILLLALFSICTTGIFIAVAVFRYIACFDLYRSCKPKNDVLFLVLSILFNVTTAFFVFACSNADEGMPAKRAPAAEQQIPYDMPSEEPEASEEEIPVVETEIVEDSE